MKMETQSHAVDTSSNNKDPLSMDIDTPELPSTPAENLNDHSASTIDVIQSKVNKDGTEQCLDSTSQSSSETTNVNQSNTDNVNQTNTTTDNLVEVLGIVNPVMNIELKQDQLDTNIINTDKTNDVEMINESNTNYSDIENKINNSESEKNIDVEQQNMCIDSLGQSNLDHSDISKSDKLTSADKLDQTSNISENVQPSTNAGNVDQPSNNLENMDEPFIMTEKLDQSTLKNLVHPTTSTENLDQAITITEKLDQTTPANIVQPSTSAGNLDPTCTNSENVVQSISVTGNLNQPNTVTENPSQEVVLETNASTENIDQVNTTNAVIENLDQSSTSKANSNEISSSTLEMLHKLGTVVERLDQPNTNQENSENQNASGSNTEPKEWVPSEVKVNLFTEDKGPHWHNVVNNLVTLPVIATNLPEVFKNFPIFGKPENRAGVEKFYDREIKKFVGCDLNDAEYEELQDYCSIDNLRTGKEFTMTTKIPHVGLPLRDMPEPIPSTGDKPDLFVLRKLKARMERDPRNMYAKKLKYRGARLIPMSSQEEQSGIPETKPPDLEPGKDILYRIRVYRPFMFSTPRVKAQIRGRHSVFSCDVVMCGRQPLTALRDRLVCRNDADLRLDVSRRPHDRAATTAKDMFPSGFLFINNVFYVDSRAGCRDTSAVIRTWAAQRGIGRFPVKDMAAVNMQDINVRLAHPEVYVHQGNCEHVFLVSEIRLLNYSDPLHLSCYPCHTSVSHNQTIYCTTCAEFGAKWVVTGCDRVPFDPAFFCEICFKQYLYKDGKKIGNFKAYAYKGNELSMLKAQS